MTVIGKINLPALVKVRRSSFYRRFSFFKGFARSLCLKSPDGITERVAQEIVRHFAGIFGSIKLQSRGQRGAWNAKVQYYRCPECRRDFDEVDVGSTRYGDGWVRCPFCATEVVRKERGK